MGFETIVRKMKGMRRVLAAWAGICVAFIVFGVVYAQQDITPPALLEVSFEPEAVDTGKGPATIAVTVHVTDDLSGVENIALFFRKAGTTQQSQVEFRPNQPGFGTMEGDPLDGLYRNTFTLPQYSAYGEWELYYVYLEDNVGNRADQTKDNVEATGWKAFYDNFKFENTEDASQSPLQQLFFPLLLTK